MSCDAHTKELWSTHETKVSCFGRLGRQGFIVKYDGPLRSEREIELVAPSGIQTGLSTRCCRAAVRLDALSLGRRSYT